MKKMNVAVYVRVSTRDQNSEMQLRDINNYCTIHDLVPVRTYIDHITGSKESRPQLDALLQEVRTPRSCSVVQGVIVWKLDRLGRSLRHLLELLDLFNKNNVAFVSVKDNIDMSTAAGRLMFQIIGAMAEFERSLIRERVTAGIENCRSKRPNREWGRRKSTPNLIPEELSLLRKEGLSWRAIAKLFKVSERTVRREARKAGTLDE